MAEENRQMVLRATKGNELAADFLTTVIGILHVWDDLIDGDHEMTAQAINDAMWDALITLPRNSFYVKNFGDLNPVLAMAIQNWKIANDFENDNEQMEVAFVIRSAYVDLVTMTATLCGGRDFGYAIGKEARKLWHNEGFTGYLDNLGKQYRDAAELSKG